MIFDGLLADVYLGLNKDLDDKSKEAVYLVEEIFQNETATASTGPAGKRMALADMVPYLKLYRTYREKPYVVLLPAAALGALAIYGAFQLFKGK